MLGLEIASQNVLYKTVYSTMILVSFLSQEKLSRTLIPVITSTYCRKYAVPFFLGHPVGRWCKYYNPCTGLVDGIIHGTLL